MIICVNGVIREATPEEERDILEPTPPPEGATYDDLLAALAAMGVSV